MPASGVLDNNIECTRGTYSLPFPQQLLKKSFLFLIAC